MFPSVINKANPITSGPNIFAGSTSGTAGSNDATGTSASFNNPTWLVGGNGVYYVSDTGNHVIRKIVTSGLVGVVTTVFGTPGTSGSTLTKLNSPRGIAIDSSNNLYVADYSNNRVLFISNGSSTASNMGTVSNVTQVAVSPSGVYALALSSLSGKNLYQFRNGTLDGVLNASYTSNSGFSYIGVNATAITCSPSGSFYWSLTPNQFQNQPGMYRLGSFQAPSNLTTSMSVQYPTQVYYSSPNVSNLNPVCIAYVGSSAGIQAGMTFTILNATPGTDLYNYQGVVLDTNRSAANNFTFKWYPNMKYPSGKPNVGAYLSNDTYDSGTSFSNILAVGYDSFLGVQTPGLFSPQDRLIFNFYFSSPSNAFPSITPPTSNSTGNTAPSLTTPPSGPAMALGGFTDTFSNYNRTTRSIDVKVFDVDCGYTGYYGPGYSTTFTLGITSGSSSTQQYSNRTGGGILNLGIGGNGPGTQFTLSGPNVPEGTVINIDTITAYDPVITYLPIAGTITVNNPFVSTTGTYYVTTWPFSARRIVRIDLGNTGGPQISTDSNGLTFQSTVISNSSNGVSVNGAFYGYYISNIQFSPNDSSIFYSSSPNTITKYSVSGDAITTTSSLGVSTYTIPSFSILDKVPTTEVMALIPNGTSNTIDIYNKRY